MGGLFGGKGDAPAPPPVTSPPTEDLDNIMMQMMAMMGGIGGVPAAPAVPSVPSIIREPEVDWSDKVLELASKAKADYGIEVADKKGRTGTILSSPLLDSETVETSSSLLGGEVR